MTVSSMTQRAKSQHECCDCADAAVDNDYDDDDIYEMLRRVAKCKKTRIKAIERTTTLDLMSGRDTFVKARRLSEECNAADDDNYPAFSARCKTDAVHRTSNPYRDD